MANKTNVLAEMILTHSVFLVYFSLFLEILESVIPFSVMGRTAAITIIFQDWIWVLLNKFSAAFIELNIVDFYPFDWKRIVIDKGQLISE